MHWTPKVFKFLNLGGISQPYYSIQVKHINYNKII